MEVLRAETKFWAIQVLATRQGPSYHQQGAAWGRWECNYLQDSGAS